jgi:hypothetical protein
VGEPVLLPWARAVMAGLDGLTPAPFRGQVEYLSDAQDAATPGAVANVEESLRRADLMFYSAKRWDEERYMAEVARLTAIRDELAQQMAPSLPPLDFTGCSTPGAAATHRPDASFSASCSTPSTWRTGRSSPTCPGATGRPRSSRSWSV